MKTADHTVHDEEGESRNNHRYAVVVQDLGTQWIQSYPCKTKTSCETERSLRKFLEPSEEPKVITFTQTIHWTLANPVKVYHGIIELLHSIDPRRKVLLKGAVRRVKEGTFAVLVQSGLDEKWWADSMDDLLADGKTNFERRFGEPFDGP